VHGDAEGAAVDLRCPDLDQFDQRLFDAGRIDIVLQAAERLDGVGGDGDGVEACDRGKSSFDPQ